MIGLSVNILCAWLLRERHPEPVHEHHGHGHHDHHHHHDHNLGSAYVHVLADAMTSVLAIVALLAARFYGWVWMDPLMGIVGALVIGVWSFGLIRSSGAVLLDASADPGLADHLRCRLEVEGDRVGDLHVWRLGPGHLGLIVSVVSDHPQPPASYRDRLAGITSLSHVTVEVHACADHGPPRATA